MNARQLLLEVRRIVVASGLFGSGGDAVYGTTAAALDAFGDGETAVAAVYLGRCTTDADDAQLIEQDVIVRHWYIAATDSDGFATSVSLLNNEETLLPLLRSLGPDSGIQSSLWINDHREMVSSRRPLGHSRTYTIRAIVTDQPTYPAARSLAASGSGNPDLTWVLPFSTSRFDYTDLHLEYASGTTAPASVGDGTEIALTKTDTSVTHGLAAGTYSFSLWTGWDTSWPLDATVDVRGSAATLENVTVT